MKIGLLSDTHGYLDPAVYKYFNDCDEIWHAGDIGNQVIDELQQFKPLKAVFGNVDELTLQRKLPEDLRFQCEGITVWMTHIGGAPPKYNSRITKLLREKTPDIFVCGHSHILRIMKDPNYKNMLYMNPGAAGNHGLHHMKTIIRFDVIGKAVKNIEVIELGKRGQIKNDNGG